MTTREFIQHLILNCELDDPVSIEAKIDNRYVHLKPSHAFRVGEDDCPETLIECKLLED